MKERVIKELKQKGILKFGEFTLKSGKKSTYYINLRECIKFPELFNNIILLMSEVVERIKPDSLLGVSYTGIPLATGISLRTRIPFCYNVKEVKNYGIPSRIVGEPTGEVLIIDDLITTGASKLELLEELSHAPLVDKVMGVLVLIDREEGGREALRERGVELYSIISKRELLRC